MAGVAALAAHFATAAMGHAGEEAKVTVVYDQALPNVPGRSIKSVLVECEPGGKSPAHAHPNSGFIYAAVLEGAIRSALNDGPEVT